jgi:poly-gamma-glutamate capsule biosynthesis protein CapA/YwtB (metallophosphatase superfamily)
MKRGNSALVLAVVLACAIVALGPTATPSRAFVDEEPAVRLMAVGDLMLGWEVGRRITRNGVASPWTKVASILREADLVVGNLECVISARGEPWPSKLIHLRAAAKAAESLVAGGFDVVSLANNHAMDFGAIGLTDTLNALDTAGIAHAGGGRNRDAARAPVLVDRNGMRVAFLGYVLPFASRTSFNTRDWEAGTNAPGLAIGTPQAVAADVAAARALADAVVVMVHGGIEYKSKPIAAQRAFADAAINAGASLVLGHHPHVLQGYMRRNDKLVAFSLGNFVFARFDGASNDSAILDVTLTPSGVTDFLWIPVVVESGVPRPAVGDEIARIMRRIPSL